MNEFKSTFSYKLIYVFRINDEAHKGLLKVGETTIASDKTPDELLPNCRELNVAAKNRINQYTQTAGIAYDLLHTELAAREVVKNCKKQVKAFSDHDVHKVFERSGIKRHYFDEKNKANEWFKVDLETVKRAIQAVKSGRISLTSNEITEEYSPIIFRPEQKSAIKQTVAKFKTGDRMLWNAKMRFGKTLTALQVAKEMAFEKVIILTHRPVVNQGWYDDFQKIFYDTDYVYGSKTNGEQIENLVDSGKKFVYFASMQDLRGSQAVGGKFDKNDYIFLIDWDFVVIDEAHEGTLTKLGQAVIDEICNQTKKPKILRLSGTPFNLLDQFKQDEIYTWDYVMEQREKANWDMLHPGDNNPYSALPQMQIYTYDLNKLIQGYFDEEDNAFNFREFFRTWTGVTEKDFKPMPDGVKVGDFVHRDDVNSFLNLLCKKDSDSNYPYSTDEYRDYFRHSLWMVPGVKEARALSKLLQEHSVFGSGVFNIVNVAGAGDEEVGYKDALAAVQNAFGDNPAETYSITISCGRLTTGVTIPEWTAVFILAGTFSTSASAYLQTIFRVQSPANINGKIKDKCCVFDFAPDRTLKMVAEAGKLSARAGDTSTDRIKMGEFLNFCPVIGIEGSKMKPFNVDGLLQQLKRAYTDRVVRNGFDDPHIYNDNLLKLDGIELKDFEELKKIIGASKQTKKQGDIDINRQGLTNEEYEEIDRIERKPARERTPEEIALLEEKKKQRNQAETARSILRGISIRIPLMVYGADVPFDKEITVDNFTDLIDDVSWAEFMPKGVDKPTFKKFAKYYEQDVFIAAGRNIRRQAMAADSLSPTERVKRIASIFNTFKNPDKETVLTPWRVVNMHLGDCLGGYDFYDEQHEELLDEPRFRDNGKVTSETVANVKAKILEINSKSGLYPLYVTYSIFKKRCALENADNLTRERQQELWRQTVEENIFVICKTSMARAITKRTLLGYGSGKINAHAFDDLLMQIKDKPEQFIDKIKRGSFWNKEATTMEFDAVVGNPPYQINIGVEKENYAVPIYNNFVEVSKKVSPKYLSMIMPARWYAGGRGLDDFRDKMLHDKSLELLFDYPISTDCFPSVDISAGICYFLWNKTYNGDCTVTQYKNGNLVSSCKRSLLEDGMETFIRQNEAISIYRKVKELTTEYFDNLISPQTPFGIISSFSKYKKENFEGAVKYYSYMKQGYVSKEYITRNQQWIPQHKLYLSAAYGERGDYPYFFLGKPFYGEPNSCCSQTYLVVGPFDTKLECINVTNYICTQFFRCMIMLKKNAQHNMRNVFTAVPMQDFTDKSDIDWSKPIPEIDAQLYKKYGLSKEETAFIESMIKPME